VKNIYHVQQPQYKRPPPHGGSVQELQTLAKAIILIASVPILIGLFIPAWRSLIGFGAGIGGGLSLLIFLLCLYSEKHP